MNSNIAIASELLSTSGLVSPGLFIQIPNVYAGYRVVLNMLTAVSYHLVVTVL